MYLVVDRRKFLVRFGSGAALCALGCVPDAAPAGRARRDAGTDAPTPDAGRPALDASTPQAPQVDAGHAPDAGRADSGADPEPPPDAGAPDAGVCEDFALLHDTRAQALYLDGTHGPFTGTIRVEWIVAGEQLELEFWHGHGGRNHLFTILPEHFQALKRGERVDLTTTEVDSHRHTLFIDPMDERYRAPGASDVRVPIC